MVGPVRFHLTARTFWFAVLVLPLASCTTNPAPVTATVAVAPARPVKVPPTPATATAATVNPAPVEHSIMLGIDVLAAENFSPIAGKRVGLFTHPAGVNRHGVSTVEVLRHAPNVKLVALFSPEHGVYGDIAAGINFKDTIDRRTGLPVYATYSEPDNKPKKIQLHQIDAMVIDLQDIGVRSYSYTTLMRKMIEACFESGVEVVVLDRPNPLGGLKVDGPVLERNWMSGVGGFLVPYVHGLTIGELARLAVGTPGGLNVPESVRLHGRLVVVPMRGWRRTMRWPETGLTFVPTSPYIPDFAACVGYAMTGLGSQLGGFTNGIGTQYPFRGVFFKGVSSDILLHELEALHLPGLAFRKVSATKANGQPALGVYAELTDWDDWRPTELNFFMMKLSCRLSPTKLVGTAELWRALKRDGARIDLVPFLAQWQRQDVAFQQASRAYWLYQ